MGARTDSPGSGQKQVAGSCEYGDEPSGFHKMRGIYWIAEDMLASQKGLSSMELVTKNKQKVLALMPL